MRKLSVLFALVFMAAIASVVYAEGPVTVTLKEQNNSGQSGTATLTEKGSDTEVVVEIKGMPAGADHPMMVHKNTCDKSGGVEYPLTNLKDGKSTTTVKVALKDLQSGNYSIRSHKSPQELPIFFLCGDIPAASAAAAPPQALPKTGAGFGPSGALAAMAVALLLLGAGVILRRRAA